MDSLQREDTVGKTGFFITFGRSSAILGASDMWHIQMPLLKEMGWWKSALLLRFAVRSCGVDQNTRRSCFLFPYEASRDQRLFLKVRCYRSEFRPLPPERRIWWLFLKLFIRPFGFFSLPGTIWESHCGENCFILKESSIGVFLFFGWNLHLSVRVCDLCFKIQSHCKVCILFSDCKGVREYIQNRSTYFVLFSYWFQTWNA